MENNPIIVSQRAQVDRLRGQVDKLRVELQLAEAVLHGMEMLEASYSGVKPVQQNRSFVPKQPQQAPTEARVGGKPKGSISLSWRKVLGSFYASNASFAASDAVDRELSFSGRELNQRAVKSLFKGYVALGFLENSGGGSYRVTDTAAERFGFNRAPLGKFVSEAEGASNGDTSASSLFSNQEGGDSHAATIVPS